MGRPPCSRKATLTGPQAPLPSPKWWSVHTLLLSLSSQSYDPGPSKDHPGHSGGLLANPLPPAIPALCRHLQPECSEVAATAGRSLLKILLLFPDTLWPTQPHASTPHGLLRASGPSCHPCASAHTVPFSQHPWEPCSHRPSLPWPDVLIGLIQLPSSFPASTLSKLCVLGPGRAHRDHQASKAWVLAPALTPPSLPAPEDSQASTGLQKGWDKRETQRPQSWILPCCANHQLPSPCLRSGGPQGPASAHSMNPGEQLL